MSQRSFHRDSCSGGKTKIPTPNCIWRELVWISSLAHVSKIHDLINLMSPPPPPPPSLKENRCWPPQAHKFQVSCLAMPYGPGVPAKSNITTHVDNRAPLTSLPLKSKRSLFGRGFHQQSLLIPEHTPSTATT